MASTQIIADNGGGLTLQVTNGTVAYQHYYDDPAHLARDLDELADPQGVPIDDWDGNEAIIDSEDCWLRPTADQIRNGGYRVMTVDEVRAIDPESSGWGNLRDLHAALGRQS